MTKQRRQGDRSLRVLTSQQDASVNIVEERLAGFLEARYVRRCDDYFVCYLSSHTGCNRGCAFCHLTATNQLSFAPSTLGDYLDQAQRVFAHYRALVAADGAPAKHVHFSFMARGEALANPHLLDRGDELMVRLGQLARDEGLPAKFCVSTIMPKTLHRSLVDVFGFTSPTIYYSLYSASDTWRGRWMPGAMPLDDALRMLVDYQAHSKKIVKIHHALILNENDGWHDAAAIVDRLSRMKLRCEFNLVRYNPATLTQGSESTDECIAAYAAVLRDYGPTKVVARVGFDVAASCGMFVDKAVPQ